MQNFPAVNSKPGCRDGLKTGSADETSKATPEPWREGNFINKVFSELGFGKQWGECEIKPGRKRFESRVV